MSKQNVPALRLEGFSGEWKTTSIGAVSALHNGRDYKHLGEGCIPVYGTGGYMASVDQALSHDKDAVGIGRKGTINKPYILRAPFWTVDTLFYVVPNQDTDLAFFYASVLQVDWMAKNTATGLPSLTSQAINSADISVPPTLEEQQAIGAIFTNLDAAINQHTLKHKSLQQAKTALMQRMFPQEGQTVPELRLEGFSGEWEDCTLGEHSHVTTGSSDVQDADPDGLYPFFVRSQHVERSNKYLFDGEAILIPGEGRLGEIFHYYVGKFDLHQRAYRISDFEDIDGKYVYWAMQHSFKDHAMQNTVKATVDSLRQPTITGFIFQKPPTLEEQQAIGAVFTQLDTLIAAEAQYIKSLKQTKTALLQRMFI